MQNVQKHRKVSGLSGNEIYCLSRLGMQPGQLCVGNSVTALGVFRGIGAGLATLGGGEVTEVTKLVHDGRMRAYNRMMEEARSYGGTGLTGVSFDTITHAGNLELLTIGSTVHSKESGEDLKFSTSADVQELYCQADAGFQPRHFVFGNVAYSIGVGGNLMGGLRKLARGEVTEYTEIFDRTRHLALQRIVEEAKKHGANAVVGIETNITPLMGTQEMMMLGTASHHASLSMYANEPVTSDMTNEEMWNMANLGYLPVRLVMGVSVYSLGFTGGIFAALQSIGGGEVTGMTELLYEARERALAKIEAEAEKYGADDVVGVKTRVYDLGGGLVEFMAIGTAVKKFDGVTTKNQQLPPQAIIQDRETFVDDSLGGALNLGQRTVSSARALQAGPMVGIGVAMIIFFQILRAISFHH